MFHLVKKTTDAIFYPHSRNYVRVFRKSEEEREKLKGLKQLNKAERQEVYGTDAKKHLNVPKRELGHFKR